MRYEKFAEQTHRDEAKRSRDDHFSEVKKWKKSFGRSMNKVNRTSLVFVDLCEVLKVQKKKVLKNKR